MKFLIIDSDGYDSRFLAFDTREDLDKYLEEQKEFPGAWIGEVAILEVAKVDKLSTDHPPFIWEFPMRARAAGVL